MLWHPQGREGSPEQPPAGIAPSPPHLYRAAPPSPHCSKHPQMCLTRAKPPAANEGHPVSGTCGHCQGAPNQDSGTDSVSPQLVRPPQYLGTCYNTPEPVSEQGGGAWGQPLHLIKIIGLTWSGRGERRGEGRQCSLCSVQAASAPRGTLDLIAPRWTGVQARIYTAGTGRVLSSCHAPLAVLAPEQRGRGSRLARRRAGLRELPRDARAPPRR